VKKKIETSKKIAWFSGICFAASLIYSMFIYSYGVIYDKMCDFTFLITLISVTGSAFATTSAFYYNKARHENVIKIQKYILKIKYLILKSIGLLDDYRVQAELDSELSKIDISIENEVCETNQNIIQSE